MPKKSKEPEKTYFIVNPHGCIHEVSYDLAKQVLRKIGYRKATQAEIEELKKHEGHQTFDDPIAEPFNPEPDAELEL